MNRSRTTRAIVLRNSRIGEMHKGVVLLTPQEGLVRAIAYGAYAAKGKLRGTTNLFCAGTAYLYADPARDSTKVTDFDVEHFFSGIRENLVRFYTASLWSESILMTYGGGGESEGLFHLLLHGLELLDTLPADRAPALSIQFVWRFLEYGGAQPDLYHCARSGEPLAAGEPAWYSGADQGFCGPSFATDDMPMWQPGALAFMRHTALLALDESLRVVPPDGSLARIKRVVYALLQDHVESPLQSLKTGSGIL